MDAVSASVDAPKASIVDVAIVGGGLGGLALAVGLRRRGFHAHVYEAAPQLRTTTSTVIYLGDNAMKALEGLHPDLRERISAVGAATQHATFVTAPPGQEPRIASRQSPKQTYMLMWARVQTAIAELLPADAIHCGHAATGYSELPGGEGLVAVHFKGQPDVLARCVVGADGINSAVRRTMHPEHPGPRYLGHMAWNCMLRMEDYPELQALRPGELMRFNDQPDPDSMTPTVIFLSDAGSGQANWTIRMICEEKTYTVGDRSAVGPPGCKERILERVRALGAPYDVVRRVIEATPEEVIYERALKDIVPLDRWVSAGGRVALLGDAAHAMHISAGQGSRMAFEDAHQLALALERSAAAAGAGGRPSGGGGGYDVPAALRAYEEIRLPRANRVARASAEAAGIASIAFADRPVGLSAQQALARGMELTAWLDQYPENMLGDPNSTWWKPSEDAGPQQPAPAGEVQHQQQQVKCPGAPAAAAVGGLSLQEAAEAHPKPEAAAA